MKRSRLTRVGMLVVLALVVLLSFAAVPAVVLAQDPPAGETPTVEPPTFTPTATTQPPATNTPISGPTATPTGVVGTATATTTPAATVTPVPGGPVTIPEPVTVVLFGTGLAALSAAVATRRGKSGK